MKLHFPERISTVAAAIALSVLAPTLLHAQSEGRFSLGAGAMYGYNLSLGHQGGGNIYAEYSGLENFEAHAAAEFHNPGYVRLGMVATPVLPLSHGALFADAALHSVMACNNGVSNLTLALSVGYRMDYFSCQLGAMTRWYLDMDGTKPLWEPVSLLYRIAAEVMPSKSKWNIGGSIANFNDYEYERFHSPIYSLFGRVGITDNLQWLIRADVKPSGVLNFAAQAWGVSARTGIKYTF